MTPAQLNEGRTISRLRRQNQKFIGCIALRAIDFTGEGYWTFCGHWHYPSKIVDST